MIAALGRFETDGPAAPAEPAPGPAVEMPSSQSVASLLADDPADLHNVLGLMGESLRCLINLEAAGAAHEPVSPHTLRITGSGRIEIAAHGPAGERDTLMVSSPKYTAPEMMRGRPLADADARVRADLYALGFVMYEYLLGRRRFRAEFPGLDDRGTDLGWMEWHSDPSRKAKPASALLQATPAPLSQLLEAMLEKDPAKRCARYEDAYRTVQELVGRTQQTQQVKVARVEGKAARSGLRMGLVACGFAIILLSLLALVARLLR